MLTDKDNMDTFSTPEASQKKPNFSFTDPETSPPGDWKKAPGSSVPSISTAYSTPEKAPSSAEAGGMAWTWKNTAGTPSALKFDSLTLMIADLKLAQSTGEESLIQFILAILKGTFENADKLNTTLLLLIHYGCFNNQRVVEAIYDQYSTQMSLAEHFDNGDNTSDSNKATIQGTSVTELFTADYRLKQGVFADCLSNATNEAIADLLKDADDKLHELLLAQVKTRLENNADTYKVPKPIFEAIQKRATKTERTRENTIKFVDVCRIIFKNASKNQTDILFSQMGESDAKTVAKKILNDQSFPKDPLVTTALKKIANPSWLSYLSLPSLFSTKKNSVENEKEVQVSKTDFDKLIELASYSDESLKRESLVKQLVPKTLKYLNQSRYVGEKERLEKLEAIKKITQNFVLMKIDAAQFLDALKKDQALVGVKEHWYHSLGPLFAKPKLSTTESYLAKDLENITEEQKGLFAVAAPAA